MMPDKRCALHGLLIRNRRTFLADLGMGFTGLVLGAMLAEEGKATLPARPIRAKSVIWLFMLGGVSHLEGFDPKPALNKYAGQKIAETPHRDILRSREISGNFRPFNGTPLLETKLLPLQVGFRKRGQSGIEISDWWPHVGSCVDDLAIVRSLWTTDFNHSAQVLFNTGRIILDGKEPSLGSWVHYGLGTVDRQLPSFVVLGRPPSDFGGGPASHQASYLGPEHDGVPLDFSDPAAQPAARSQLTGSERAAQKSEFDFIGDLNRLSAAEYPTDLALQARIRSYELAFHMQTEVPALFNLGDESEPTRRLYGLDEPTTQPFARQCLIARRLVERGVRFIQIYHGGSADDDNGLWDSHHELRLHHSQLCREVDRPIAGLLKDLKQRGLLDSTLVVWASEFGRAPNFDIRTPKPAKVPEGTGRDHHIYGFSCWLAGAGIKGGIVHGATDELGFHAVEDRHYITDIHATVLHQLGLDPEKLQIPGRKRLELERGRHIKQILA